MLKEMRELKGITQAELSKKTGIPQGVISYIESGRTKHPRVDTIKALAEALDCKIEDLLEKAG